MKTFLVRGETGRSTKRCVSRNGILMTVGAVNPARRASASRVPTQAIRYWVGQQHVGTADEEIAAEVASRLAKAGATTAEVRRGVAVAIKAHRENQKLYDHVMGGGHGYRNARKHSAGRTGFKRLSSELTARPGVRDPKALAAWIGRRKYGRAAFERLAAEGRRNPLTHAETGAIMGEAAALIRDSPKPEDLGEASALIRVAERFATKPRPRKPKTVSAVREVSENPTGKTKEFKKYVVPLSEAAALLPTKAGLLPMAVGRYEEFHEGAATRVEVYEYEDGSDELTERVMFKIGTPDITIDTVEDARGKDVRIKPIKIGAVYKVSDATASNKAGKQWIHSFRDDKGKPPILAADVQTGNMEYVGGTVEVRDWLRR